MDEAEVKEEEDEMLEDEDITNCEETRMMMCDVCPAVCKSVRALQKHKKVKHDTRQCICPECGISVEGMDKLRYYKSQITNHKNHK